MVEEEILTRPTKMGLRWLLALGVVTLALLVASPARASHVITWSVGADCRGDVLEAEASGPTTFSVCVEFGGSPMSGWQMTVQMVAADGTTHEFEIVTDSNGKATFDVEIGDGGGVEYFV